jgi:hypothetical protein
MSLGLVKRLKVLMAAWWATSTVWPVFGRGNASWRQFQHQAFVAHLTVRRYFLVGIGFVARGIRRVRASSCGAMLTS